ncbi:MAG: hypothetical protein MUQ27_02700 [Acidimicrobiia bacterium]|nr:hypothetical protein [Acidimicrobiia bacterium]
MRAPEISDIWMAKRPPKPKHSSAALSGLCTTPTRSRIRSPYPLRPRYRKPWQDGWNVTDPDVDDESVEVKVLGDELSELANPRYHTMCSLDQFLIVDDARDEELHCYRRSVHVDQR